MINTDYLIDYSGWFDEGGYCQVYPIKNQDGWVFKEFKNKKKAQQSYKYQKRLSKFDLAPQIYSKICRLEFAEDDGLLFTEPSYWGYITEKAYPVKHNSFSMRQIQNLVDNIYIKTGLKFWDCHWYNVGSVIRLSKKTIVCIDTGVESFDGYSNAWGNPDPGPKCSYCLKYACNCEE